MRPILRLLPVLLFVSASGCSRYGFPARTQLNPKDDAAKADSLRDAAPTVDTIQPDTAHADTLPHADTHVEASLEDASPDLHKDIGASDCAHASDLPPADLGASPSLTCSPPAGVGSGAPTLHEERVAVRTDHLSLVARGPNSWYEVHRANPGQPFGVWSTVTFPSASQGDPTFFTYTGKEMAIVATAIEPRSLLLCTAPSWTCDPITVLRADTQKTVTLDMDGPSVAVLPSGDLIMTHNIGPQGKYSGDIYLARAIFATAPPPPPPLPTTWETTPVDVVSYTPTIKENDPSLSPNGLILLFSMSSSQNDQEIWISQRPSLSSPFPIPVLLSDLNTSYYDGGAIIIPFAGHPGQYEVFFASNRPTGGKSVASLSPFRALCHP